ncbi:MAG: arsenosugar biosynthesis radical SAM protein ArsS [Myxococcales bacterium]|nr:arsenosugar biosynthesis radical SAM protein ArsS [Myxococcales bacterium]
MPLAGEGWSFDEALRDHGTARLVRRKVTTLQVNLGKVCNMACRHCHVEAGPNRKEVMPRAVAERIVELLARDPRPGAVDLTGGAPELNPSFLWLVREARRLGLGVIDRCNLTILFEQGMEDLPEFLASHRVHIIASLPCYEAENVEKQRGRGVFAMSLEALRRLNGLGYGRSGSSLELDLVYNPIGATLPPPQSRLEAKYKDELRRRHGIEFHRLFATTNMPIQRFAQFLERTGQHAAYMCLLASQFNQDTVPELMCRSLVSVGWDGKLYDCDFNQMLELPAGASTRTVWDIDSFGALDGCRIATGRHCFGCTAGAGSSCTGTLR